MAHENNEDCVDYGMVATIFITEVTASEISIYWFVDEIESGNVVGCMVIVIY